MSRPVKIMTGPQLRVLLETSDKKHSVLAAQLQISERSVRRYVSGQHAIPRVVELAVLWILEHEDDS